MSPPSARSAVGLAGLLTALLASPEVASAQEEAPSSTDTGVRPIAECVVPNAGGESFAARFGSASPNTINRTYASGGIQNFFTPVAADAGSTAVPGYTPNRVTVRVPYANSPTFSESWALTTAATANLIPRRYLLRGADGNNLRLELPPTPPCGPTVQGDWDQARTYYPNDIVRRDGTSWIARLTNSGQTPTEGTTWTAFALAGRTGDTDPQGRTGDPGPRGETGTAGTPGSTGPAGPRGATGPRGAAGATASRTVGRFDRRGRVTLRNPTITASSVVMLQYA